MSIYNARVLGGHAGLRQKQFVPVATPLSPLNTTSSTLTESFIFAPPYLYTDSGGSFTTPNTTGNTKIGSVKAYGSGRTETLIQTASSSQPTYGGAGTGFGAVTGDTYHKAFPACIDNYVNSQYGFVRSYLGAVGTVLMVIKPQYSGNYLGATQVIVSNQTASGTPIFLIEQLGATSPSIRDSIHIVQNQSDSSTIQNDVQFHLGSPDVLCWRSDPTNGNSIARSGNIVGGKVTGTGSATTGCTHAYLGNSVTSAGAIGTNGLQGSIHCFFTWSGPLSDAEMKGVSAWAQQTFTQQQSYYEGNKVGLYFYGNGVVNNEAGAGLCAAMVRSGDFVNWNHVPLIYNPYGISGISVGPERDMGAAYDAATNAIYFGTTSVNGTFHLWSILDKMTVTYVSDPSVSSLTGSPAAVWAPEFVRNLDGTMWKDGAGLPRVVFAYLTGNNSGGTTGFSLGLVKPSDTTWSSGGGWAAATAVAWATAPYDGIDPSIIYNPGDGLFHMVFCQRNNTPTSYISHATASSLDGTWTQIGNVDAFGFGTGYEGPQINYRDYDNSWIIHVDNQGGAYKYARSTVGPGGSYSALAPVNCPFCPEQGNMFTVPQGW